MQDVGHAVSEGTPQGARCLNLGRAVGGRGVFIVRRRASVCKATFVLSPAVHTEPFCGGRRSGSRLSSSSCVAFLIDGEEAVKGQFTPKSQVHIFHRRSFPDFI